MPRAATTKSARPPADPDSEILLEWGDPETPGERVQALIISDRADHRAVAARLRQVAETSSRIARISGRLQISFDQLVAALDDITAGEPMHSRPADTQLSGRDVAALTEAGVSTEQDPPAVARSAGRTAAHYAQLVQTSRTVAEAARALGVSQARIRQRIAGRTLYAFQGPRGWLLPEFQFASYGALHGIEAVLAALPSGLHPISVDGFFRRPNPDLDTGEGAMTIAAWLASGGPPEAAAELARDLLTTP